jgi:hypothetical protein
VQTHRHCETTRGYVGYVIRKGYSPGEAQCGKLGRVEWHYRGAGNQSCHGGKSTRCESARLQNCLGRTEHYFRRARKSFVVVSSEYSPTSRGKGKLVISTTPSPPKPYHVRSNHSRGARGSQLASAIPRMPGGVVTAPP